MKNKVIYIWGGVEKFLPEGLYLITNIILARYLTPQDFGTVGVLAVFIAIAGILTDSGLGGSLVKEHTITKLDCSTVFVFNLIISLTIYVFLFVCAPYIEGFYKIPDLKIITRYLCLIFVINSIGLVPKSLLIKELKFKKIAISSLCGITTASIFSFIGCYLNLGVYVLVIFQLSCSIITTTSLLLLSKYSISFKFSYTSFRKLVSFGVFSTICGVIDSIYENVLSVLFGKFINAKFLGYYDQAKKLERGSASSVSTALNNVSFPILSKLKKYNSEFTQESFKILKFSIITFFPLLSIISIYSDYIVILLFGEKWYQSSPILSILMINGMVFMIESNIRNNIKSLGNVKQLALMTAIKRIIGIAVIMSFMLISKYAMIYGLVASTFVGVLVNVMLFCKLTNIKFINYIIILIKIIFPTVLFYLICLLCKSSIPYQLSYSLALSIGLLITYYYIMYRNSINYYIKKILNK